MRFMKASDYLRPVKVDGQELFIHDIRALEEKGIADIGRLPFTIRILVENLLRKLDGHIVTEEDVLNISGWQKNMTDRLRYHIIRPGF